MFRSVKKKKKIQSRPGLLHIILSRCNVGAVGLPHCQRHLMCHHVGFRSFNSFMLFMFFRSKEDSLSMQDVITIQHQTGKMPKMKSTANAENKVLHQKKDILNKSQKLHILEGWGVFEFLSFWVRQLNSNESGRAAPANCARRVADLDVYSNDHRSTSQCKLFYASTWS